MLLARAFLTALRLMPGSSSRPRASKADQSPKNVCTRSLSILICFSPARSTIRDRHRVGVLIGDRLPIVSCDAQFSQAVLHQMYDLPLPKFEGQSTEPYFIERTHLNHATSSDFSR